MMMTIIAQWRPKFIIKQLLRLPYTQAVIWLAVAFVALYRPTQGILGRILPVGFVAGEEHRAIQHATRNLTSSLDAPKLVTTIVEGLQTQFEQPALAFFLGDIGKTNRLSLQYRQRMSGLPQEILPGALTDQFRKSPSIVETRSLRHMLSLRSLTPDEQKFVLHPSIVLWCPIHHAQGHLLGLLLLGMRGDLDPYRRTDQQELERLMSAASLAFSNSAALAQQVEAEGMIRQLHKRVQAVQDAMANGIVFDSLKVVLRRSW